jgi:hypothetical protein
MREFRDQKEAILRGPKEFTAKFVDGGIEIYYQGAIFIKEPNEIKGRCLLIDFMIDGWNVIWA